MTAEEALRVARAVAEENGWPWQGPVNVSCRRSFLFLGKARWRVWTNAESLGMNVRVEIDDATRQVRQKAFLHR